MIFMAKINRLFEVFRMRQWYDNNRRHFSFADIWMSFCLRVPAYQWPMHGHRNERRDTPTFGRATDKFEEPHKNRYFSEENAIFS